MFDSSKPPIADAHITIAANKKNYRCYFTGSDDRIRSYEPIECEDDAEAALKAQELLAASHFTSAELWLGKRLVAKWGNTSAASPMHEATADSST